MFNHFAFSVLLFLLFSKLLNTLFALDSEVYFTSVLNGGEEKE